MMYKKLYNYLFTIIFILSALLFYVSFTTIIEDNEVINKIIFLFFIPLLILLNVSIFGLSLRKLLSYFLILLPVFLVLYLKASFSYTIAFFYAINILMPRNTDFRFIYLFIFIKVIFIFFIIFLWWIGFLPDITIVKSDGESIAHSLGFSHPNSLGAIYFSVVLDYVLLCFLKNKKSNFIGFLFVFLSAVLYFISYSRTAIFLSFSLLFILFFKSFFVRFYVNKIFSILALLLVFFLGVYLSYGYDPGDEIFIQINNAFSQRLAYANKYIDYYGFSYIPQKIEVIYDNNYNMIYNENFYTATILSQGWILSVLFFLYLCYQITKNKISLYVFSLMLVSLVCAMFEGYGMSVFFSSVFLFKLSIRD